MFDDLVLGAPEWVWPASAIGVVLAAIALWSYGKRDAPLSIRIPALLMKLSAIGMIVICLVEPMRRGTRPRGQSNILPILVDNSRSMNIKATGSSSTQYENVVSKVSGDADWLVRLGQSFDVRRYRFAGRLENVDDYASVAADGDASSLTTALQSLSERFKNRPVGGVILFTDGNATDGNPTDGGGNEVAWSDFGFPIYPVIPDVDDSLIDLRISDISIRLTDFESAPTTIVVSIDAINLPNSKQDAVVQLMDIGGKVIEEQSIKIDSESQTPTEVKFRFRPETSGVSFFTASVFVESDRESIQADSGTSSISEATLINNRRIVAVNRDSGPYRVLYVAGRPNWEFKFLRRAMESDAEIQMVGLLRIAKKEAKFSFRDREVSDTNPLFAGLGKDEEEIASQYDEPVILRFGVNASDELSDGFPESDEELFGYHGVILDDIETEFFTQDQLLRLRRFVSSRGGGLLLLGGQESFSSKDFASSTLGELSPVYPPRSDAMATRLGPFALTREGMLNPWMRMRDTESDEKDRVRSMPPFMTINPVGDIKPGASRLATIEAYGESMDSEGRPRETTAMAVQRFGKGRTAALTIGDLWRWSMQRAADDPTPRTKRDDPSNRREDPEQSWRQTLHWLVGEVPQRVELKVEVTDDPSAPVTLVVTARDEAFMPLDNAMVEVTVTPIADKNEPVGEALTLTAQADRFEPGVYKTAYWARNPGGYLAKVNVKSVDGSDVGTDELGWSSRLGDSEFADLRLNRKLLQRIADESGGQIVKLSSLENFASDLPNRKMPASETWVYPLWHRSWIMIAVIACLCGEWGLRRWKGLA